MEATQRNGGLRYCEVAGLKLIVCLVLLFSSSAWGALTYDNSTATGNSTEDLSWDHTTGASPEVVIVCITEEVLAGQAQDGITGVTYGGVAMTELTGSPLFHAGNSADDSGSLHVFYLRAGVPTGTTVTTAVDGTVARSRGAIVYTLQSAGSCKFKDIDVSLNTVAADPSVSLSLGGEDCWVAMVFGSGQQAVSGITPLATWTSGTERDHGTGTGGSYRKTVISANDTVAAWSQLSDDAYMIAFAIADSTPTGGGEVFKPLRRKSIINRLVGWINIDPPLKETPAIWYDRKWTG